MLFLVRFEVCPLCHLPFLPLPYADPPTFPDRPLQDPSRRLADWEAVTTIQAAAGADA